MTDTLNIHNKNRIVSLHDKTIKLNEQHIVVRPFRRRQCRRYHCRRYRRCRRRRRTYQLHRYLFLTISHPLHGIFFIYLFYSHRLNSNFLLPLIIIYSIKD